jgi:hypothetical protein
MENKNTKVLAIKNYNLNKPEEVTKMAVVLKNHIVKNSLYSNIKGKNYVHVEGWQFAGGLLGTYPRVVKVESLETHAEGGGRFTYKWLAEVEIVRVSDEKVISRGFALCSNKEPNKTSFDEYAVLSMAQTRAIGKAYRNVIAWVMKMAGYEATPAEEMDVVEVKKPVDGKKVEKGSERCWIEGCTEWANPMEKAQSLKFFKKVLCEKHLTEAEEEQKKRAKQTNG